jgi:hypothetical protein
MASNTVATMLHHPADAGLVGDLRRELLRRSPTLDLVLKSVLDPSVAVGAATGPTLLIGTTRLFQAPQMAGLRRRFEMLARGRSIIALLFEDAMPANLTPAVEIIDMTAWNVGPVEYELGQVVARVTAWIPFIDWPEPADDLTPELLGRVEDLPLSLRARRILADKTINYVGDLVLHPEYELLRFPGVGRKTLREIKRAVEARGLYLGMVLPQWPPANVEEELARLAGARHAAVLQQVKGGATFEPAGDRFSIVGLGDAPEDDEAAAMRPMTMQMHGAVLDKAKAFAAMAIRLDNQVGWGGIGRSAATLVELLDRPTARIPEVLGYLYPAALEMGSFVEMDQRLTAASDGYAAPLDAETRRPLDDLLRSLAPWLRSFPSVREFDEDAGRFLVAATELRPTFDVVDAARDAELLAARDLEIFRQLGDAATRGMFMGGKAGGVIKRSAMNLAIAASLFAAHFMVDAVNSDFATTSPLTHKAGQFLVRGEKAIEQLAREMAPDLRMAIRQALDDVGAAGGRKVEHEQPSPGRPRL